MSLPAYLKKIVEADSVQGVITLGCSVWPFLPHNLLPKLKQVMKDCPMAPPQLLAAHYAKALWKKQNTEFCPLIYLLYFAFGFTANPDSHELISIAESGTPKAKRLVRLRNELMAMGFIAQKQERLRLYSCYNRCRDMFAQVSCISLESIENLIILTTPDIVPRSIKHLQLVHAECVKQLQPVVNTSSSSSNKVKSDTDADTDADDAVNAYTDQSEETTSSDDEEMTSDEEDTIKITSLHRVPTRTSIAPKTTTQWTNTTAWALRQAYPDYVIFLSRSGIVFIGERSGNQYWPVFDKDNNPVKLGEGGAAQVFVVQDVTGHRFALKLQRPPGDDAQKRGLISTEIQVMHEVTESGDAVAKKHVITAKEMASCGSDQFGAIRGIVMEIYTSGDLQQHLKTTDRDGNIVPWGINAFRRLSQHMLLALRAFHAANYVHGDIKPDNMFLRDVGTRTQVLVLADLGLARRNNAGSAIRIPYVGTLHYRPPEAMCSSLCDDIEGRTNCFGPWNDMWAVGIIALNLLGVSTPFQIPEDQSWRPAALLGRIHEVLGNPALPTYDAVRRTTLIRFVEHHPALKQPKNANLRDQIVDLLDKLLQAEPSKRITAEAALQHPFFINTPQQVQPSRSVATAIPVPEFPPSKFEAEERWWFRQDDKCDMQQFYKYESTSIGTEECEDRWFYVLQFFGNQADRNEVYEMLAGVDSQNCPLLMPSIEIGVVDVPATAIQPMECYAIAFDADNLLVQGTLRQCKNELPLESYKSPRIDTCHRLVLIIQKLFSLLYEMQVKLKMVHGSIAIDNILVCKPTHFDECTGRSFEPFDLLFHGCNAQPVFEAAEDAAAAMKELFARDVHDAALVAIEWLGLGSSRGTHTAAATDPTPTEIRQYAKIPCFREDPETAESFMDLLEHIFVKKDYQTAADVCKHELVYDGYMAPTTATESESPSAGMKRKRQQNPSSGTKRKK